MYFKMLGITFLLLVVIQCSAEVPKVTFNNGQKIPILGFGTWKVKENEITQAVKDAIDVGYRHFDCAYIYQNEKGIGNAIADKIAQGVVEREDLFITSKLWNTFHKPERVEENLKLTLKTLGLEYLDLYLIHWPTGFKEDSSGFSDDDYVDTWIAMEKVYQKGLAKSIGISNFNKKQIDRLLERATVVPVTNQVECHPYLNQKKLIDFCKTKNITITAYSPLGGAGIPQAKTNLTTLFENPKIIEVAKNVNKSPAQVVLRYQVQRGVIVIPKSAHKNRIAENFNIFDFQLSASDMAAIDSLDVHGRITLAPEMQEHKYYPFSDEY